MTTDVETTEKVTFLNFDQPRVRFLVENDPNAAPGQNASAARNIYATFVNGRLETDDPKVIAWCRSEVAKRKGVLDTSDPKVQAEIHAGDVEWMEAEIERRAKILAAEQISENKHEEKTNRKPTAEQAAESVRP